ncbi:MAG: hypothetical protein M0D55_07660 [Elusimicrobiota bacterium]|nr:MAG: hypothetical protein M0D55_07660 [Elusimicrobiota bacterium]
MIRSILVSAVVVALSVSPSAELCEGFLPENDLKIPIGSLEDKGISQAQFNAVIDQAEKLYGPVVAARGGKLVIKRLWDNETVNASAQRQGANYVVNMYGGLARHETITQDGFALVVCHEIGHHIGGAPKYGGGDWASNEGQSDYFANLECLRRMFSAPGASSFTRPKGDDPGPRPACEKVFADASDAALCVRGAAAGMSVTSLFRALRRETVIPRYDTPDPKVVASTADGHPATQCRLDTYYAGSICGRRVDEAMSETDALAGTCTAQSGHTLGLRPRCWYKPAAAVDEVLEGVASRAHPKTPAALAELAKSDVFRGL